MTKANRSLRTDDMKYEPLAEENLTLVSIEVKSSGIGKHESITEFQKKYSKHVAKEILLSQNKNTEGV